MPKAAAVIKQFHGGISNNSSSRDIADNELVSAKDVMVDEIGIVRNMGGNTAHDAGTISADIKAGYGLHQFSNDYSSAHVGGEHLNNGSDFTSNWTASGSGYFNLGADLTYSDTESSGLHTDTVYQTAAQRKEIGSNSVQYIFYFDVTGFDSGQDLIKASASIKLKGGSGYFPSADVDLMPYMYNGSHYVIFTSHSSASSGKFQIEVDSQSAGEGDICQFNLDNLSLHPYSTAISDDYLALADNESGDPAIYVYSRTNDVWSQQERIKMGSSNDFKAVMYNVDGSLRVSDAGFGDGNQSQWYGQIARKLFKNISPSYNISEWTNTPQALSAPVVCRMQSDNDGSGDDGDYEIAGILSTGDNNTLSSTGTATYNFKGAPNNATSTSHTLTHNYGQRVNLAADGASGWAGAMSNVAAVKIEWSFEILYTLDQQKTTDINTIGITCGRYTTDTSARFVDAQEIILFDNQLPKGTYSGTTYFYFDITKTGTGVSWGGDSSEDQFRVAWSSISSTCVASSLSLGTPVAYETASIASPDVAFNGTLEGNEIYAQVDWTNSGGSNWQSMDNDKSWAFACSFIYDGTQESPLTEFVSHNGTRKTFTPTSSDLASPSFRFFLRNWQDGQSWNKRITGFNFYAKDLSSKTDTNWYLQAKADFAEGKIKSMATGYERDVQYLSYSSNNSTYVFDLFRDANTAAASTTALPAPANWLTYEASSGKDQENPIIDVQYKTAVVSNRQVYIGNVNISYGAYREVMGDAIIKTPVNKFDTFSKNRIIEAAVRDGDEIVKLAAYADRLLQFKKQKMTILNIAQDIEFVEDTFDHKGVKSPGAVCNTDFGVAWVNKLGCYLFDGQRVTNLLEKGGRQIIKESTWNTFAANDPMIGYVPSKRQLIVVDDCTTTGNGAIYLYDMVTQSWVNSNNAAIQSQNLTNFIVDWNGDLTYAYNNSGTATVMKWSDASTAKTAVEIITKEIDFGQPAQRKKVYKLYINYKGGHANLDVQYSVDSGANWNAMDANLTNTGSTTVEAAIKPSATINNAKTIMFKISGATNAGFELNDMSIIFRGKPIK